ANKIFTRCLYFPFEFSLFLTFKQYVVPRREECLFSLFQDTTMSSLISVGFSKDRVVFRYKGQRYRFKIISMAAEVVTVTRDCRQRRRRPLATAFPDLLPVVNTSFSIGRCKQSSSVFQGLLKSVILVPGRDASVHACPPEMDLAQGLGNIVRTFPGLWTVCSRSSLTPFYTTPVMCEWTDVGNIAFDVYARKLKVCVNGVWREVKVSPDKRKLDYLLPHQLLDTGQGVLDIEVFEIPGEGTFAAYASAGLQTSVQSRSNIYHWADSKLTLYQTLPTQSAQAWKFFSIRNQFFLAVANYGINPSIPSNSTIFKWNKVRKKFHKYQDIVTYTARDVEAFEINGHSYLAVANHAQGDNNQIDSIVYKWSSRERQFLEHQRLLTIGAYDWTHFTVDGYHFLAVANAFSGLTTLVFSVLYFWQNSSWIQFQTLEVDTLNTAYCSVTSLHFTINNDHYLAVANAYNYGSQNYQEIDSYRTNSTIYKLDRDKRVFTRYQSICTNSAVDWEYLHVGDDHYLIVSNAQNGGAGDRLLTFVPSHYLHTLPNADFEVIKDGSDIYLLYANAKNAKSEVLRVKFL
ncbi:unnamed protein product, partial [Candidula unifasciata]